MFCIIQCKLKICISILNNTLPSWRPSCLQSDSNFIANNLRKKMSLRHFSVSHIIYTLIFGIHLGRHLGYIEMLNDARVASLGFFKDKVCTTRIKKEKKFKIKFQVLLKFTQILPDASGTVLFMFMLYIPVNNF